MPNSYSRRWFELFLETRPYTTQELEFVVRNLPNPPFGRVLDLCCGQGRLSNPLSANGYEVVGVDLDDAALGIAASDPGSQAKYLRMDMRRTADVPGTFDAVLCWWQSFGYFDELTNCSVVEQVSSKLRDGGRLLLDLYQRKYWESNQGERLLERLGTQIRSLNLMTGNRLASKLEYVDGSGVDSFEWQLFDVEEISELAESYGLNLLLACTACDEERPVTGCETSMQLVFQKVS